MFTFNREKFIQVCSECKISNNKLAKLSGVATNTIRNFKLGLVDHPNPENTYRILHKGFGITEEEWNSLECLDILKEKHLPKPTPRKAYKIVDPLSNVDENFKFGELVKSERIKRNISPSRLASLVGVDYPKIFSIERGIKANDSLKQKIMETLSSL